MHLKVERRARPGFFQIEHASTVVPTVGVGKRDTQGLGLAGFWANKSREGVFDDPLLPAESGKAHAAIARVLDRNLGPRSGRSGQQ